MCWFIRYEFICFSQNDLSAWTELAGPSMNCAPNTLFEFPGAQECFISQFISPVCLCSFNFLPIEVHFCIRIPVKTRGIQASQLWLSGGQCVGYSFSSCRKTVDSWEWDELPCDGSQGEYLGCFLIQPLFSLSGHNGDVQHEKTWKAAPGPRSLDC